MDRNQIIGLVLIAALMMVYVIWFGQQPPAEVEVAHDTTTVERAETQPDITQPQPEDTTQVAEELRQQFGELAIGAQGSEERLVLENEKIQLKINTHGGKIDSVLLKDYLTDRKDPLYLVDEIHSQMQLIAQTPQGSVNLKDLYYEATKNIQGDTSSLVLRLSVAENRYIEQIYTLLPNAYQLNYSINIVGLDNVIHNEPLQFNWNANLPRIEYDLEQSRIRSTVNYYTLAGDFDYLSETTTELQTEQINEPLKWVSMKQKFFNSAIIAQNQFERGTVSSQVVPTDTVGIKSLEANLLIPIGDVKAGGSNFQFYFGPNHYRTLRQVTEGFHRNVYLGWPVINWINRFIVVPVFHFLEQFIPNYGIIIIILVILIKLILLPLSYKSYLSMAKMKVLKPELDEIKAKYSDDMQKVQTEQMQLYQKVGINPLSGCIPLLLQMPILLAMFNFFPNSIELRQESFLWAHDLSTYDAPILLPFTIPFYGSHVSIFTLLMTLSTIGITYFNNQTSTVQGPMKSLSYTMPVIFMFVLNSFPAGLSFYYLMSNIVTMIQQQAIKKFVNEDKIKEALEENRRKIASGQTKKSKWMLRVEEAMKAKEEEARKRKKK
ncbi:membrane protein insertase YidC [Cytophagaceae bacterium ABcell3]|nr:membrane protein insertase YidC [Cytophagaceae bacterium ABcell3]